MSNIIVRGVLESMIPQAWRWQIWKASKVSSFGILLRSYHRGCSAAAFCGGFWFFGFLVFFSFLSCNSSLQSTFCIVCPSNSQNSIAINEKRV